MTYVVYMNGNKICPKCTGMMVRYGGEMAFRCLDCGAHYRILGLESEKEFALEELMNERGSLQSADET